MSPQTALLVIIVTVLLAGFAAGSETAVVSCSKVRLRHRAAAGSWRARVLERLIGSPEYFFSVVLVATNLAVITCSAAATDLAVRFAGDAGPAVATIVMTPVMLILGEVIPKSVFLYHADRVAVAVAPFLEFLGYLLWPLVMPAALLVRLLVRATGGARSRLDILTSREEIVYLYRVGKKEGALERRERRIIDRVFQFEEVRARDILIPMSRVVSFPVTASVDEVIEEVNKHPYSRYPLTSPVDGRVVGIISTFELLGLDGGEKLSTVMHEPLIVKENDPAERLLVLMKNEALHMAVVTGENAEHIGIVNLENVLQSIIGDVYGGEYQGTSLGEL